MERSTTEPLSEKTAEKQLLREFEFDFELAPATSRALLETVQQGCCRERVLARSVKDRCSSRR